MSQQDEPIADFSQCHAGIFRKLDQLSELPALLEPAARARDVAEKSLEFFREAIFEHHLDEERELFPAVLASCRDDAERERVTAMNRQLTDEHRELERLWKGLESGLKRVVKGQFADVDVAQITRLVSQYRAHAQFEEQDYLPLAQQILGRNGNQMAALGLSLHMRHQNPTAFQFYV